MLNILLLDQKYISYTLQIRRCLARFLFARRPFPFSIDGATFLITPRSSDLFTIYEIFSDRGYQPKLPGVQLEPRMVVDFGANIGIFSVWACLTFRPESLIAVEMEPRCYQRLVDNIALNHLEGIVQPVQAAIFNHSGSVGIKKVSGAAFFKVAPQRARLQVPAFSFADFFQLHRLERIDLLKIDIEGAEKYLLTEENAALFQQRVGYILLETHSLNDFRVEHAAAYLRKLGFQLTLTPTPYKIDHNYIIDAHMPIRDTASH